MARLRPQPWEMDEAGLTMALIARRSLMHRTMIKMRDRRLPSERDDAVQLWQARKDDLETYSGSSTSTPTIREWLGRLLKWQPSSTRMGASSEVLSSQTSHRLVPRDLPASDETSSVGPEVMHPIDVEKIEGILASVSRHEAEYSFEPTPLVDCAVLFAPGQVQGSHTTIRLNTLHPAFPLFTVLLADEDANHVCDEADLRIRYREARAALQLLVESWTRMEGDLTGVRERRASELREDWGRVARQLLNGD